MKEYSRKEWGITETEYSKLKEAVSQGIINELYINDILIYKLKLGLINVDEFIGGFSGSDELDSVYGAKKGEIDLSTFKKIVSSVLDEESIVVGYSFFDIGVNVTFRSKSGKQKWDARLDFNDNGMITGEYSYSQAYRDSTNACYIGNKIRNRIKSALYE